MLQQETNRDDQYYVTITFFALDRYFQLNLRPDYSIFHSDNANIEADESSNIEIDQNATPSLFEGYLSTNSNSSSSYS